MTQKIHGLLITGLAAILIAGPVAAQVPSPPEGLVWMALNAINGDAFDRDDPTNRPPLVTEVPEGMLRPVDVSRDGRADWIVDFRVAGLSAFCGTGGCAQILYVSGGDTGFVRAFDNQALEFEVAERGGEARVEAMVHRLNCRPEQPECLYAWAWDPTLGRLVERPASNGLTRLQGGGFDPTDATRADTPDSLPNELSQVWFGGRLTCRDESDDGFVALRPEFRSVPDINGDGQRDWIGIPPVCEAETMGSPSFELWVTTGNGELELAYTSASNRYPSIDIRTTPATVLVNPSCDYDEPCPDERLRWDGPGGRFSLVGS